MTTAAITKRNYSPEHVSILNQHYSPRRADLIASMLTEEELRVIDTTKVMDQPESEHHRDYFRIAFVDWLIRERPDRAEKLGEYDKADFSHYRIVQREWMAVGRVLVARRLPPNATEREIDEEFSRDFWEKAGGLRFRLWYRFAHRKKIKPIKKEDK